MAVNFADRLATIQAGKRTQVALIIRPRLLQMPLPIQRYDDPFLPFGKAIISATHDVVCAYVFDLAAYMALGAAGAVALERTIAFARGNGNVVNVLHAPFASPDYVEAVSDNAFAADAVKLVDEQYLADYTANPELGAYVVKRGETPVIIPLPGNAGVYWQDAGLFTMLSPDGHNVQMYAAGDRVLYAGRGDDFAERARAAIEEMRS